MFSHPSITGETKLSLDCLFRRLLRRCCTRSFQQLLLVNLQKQQQNESRDGFSEAFDGVVLTYEPKFCSNLAKILPGIHPYFGVRFEAKLLLFHPKPGMLLEGEVVKVSQQSIHIIVLGFSSAVIADEDIREDFKYKMKHGKDVFVSRSHQSHRIKVGTTLRFLVKSFDEEILHICGSLIPANTGSVQWLERKSGETQADSVTEKNISNKRAAEVFEPDNLVPDREKLKSENRMKKSRRSKSRDS